MSTDASRAGSNGFIASITEGFSSGLKSLGEDVLPVWAANQLGTESGDQLNESTYNARSPQAPTRIDQLAQSVTGGAQPTSVLILAALGVVVVGGVLWMTR